MPSIRAPRFVSVFTRSPVKKLRVRAVALLSLIVCALPLAAIGATSQPATPTANIEALRVAVVKVRTRELVVDGAGSRSEETVSSQGSGVVLTPDGKVLTAAHLVQTADEIDVEFGNGTVSRARVFASEPAADLALLELRPPTENMPAASLGDSDTAMTGDSIIVLGFPFDLPVTATFGRLSGRVLPTTPLGPFVQPPMFTLDAHVLPGTSGGPLLDASGRVIGIATRLMTTGSGLIGLSFGATSNAAKALLVERRSLWTGMSCRLVSGALAAALNLPQSAGLLVERIAAYSPASALRLQGGTAAARINGEELVLGGDVILSILGISMADARGYERASAAMAQLVDGDILKMRILRSGRVLEVESALVRMRRISTEKP